MEHTREWAEICLLAARALSCLIGCELVPHEHRIEAENENIQLLMHFRRTGCCFSSGVASAIS